ncbi:related to phosphatidylinositol/phosphatidylcholine transfer protein [Rhynchosporium secalis]|uniref:Related to phosphatidylinositol/phosphatidylcholine transfer protein n=1 Tax=Rhynchosporium secalis TaxID=38038 RepID=A0A1E1MRZ7_RHYSE|nr:related to phosphatidylinositol/phosphatidylcholine transfer protein [Rhynchosporium secalis]
MSTAGPAHRVQSAMVEYGFPSGHLGHLSPEEETAFQNFKTLCEEKGCYTPGESGTHDDATLLRFLRARRFSVADAFKQFQDTEEWRKANQLDTLYETIDLQQFEETRSLYPQWTGRRDRRGIPVYVFEVKHLNAQTMSAYEKSAKSTSSQATTDGNTPAKLLRLFALYENLIRFVLPLCTALTDREHPRTPITQSNNIVDISGVGLKQFWNLRAHMQDASTLATAHYPETLDRIFIIGAPSFFPTVWGWIKKWFDPITTSKIFILSSADMKKTLESFIDPINIPVKYGGQLKYTFGDPPVFDPAIEKIIKWEGERSEFPQGPMYWKSRQGERLEGRLGEETNAMTAVAVGSVEGKQREEVIGTVTRTLGRDPYVDGLTNGRSTAGNTLTVPGSQQDLSQQQDLEKTQTATTADDEEVRPSGVLAPSKSQLEAPTVPSTPMHEVQGSVHEVQGGEVVPATRPEPNRFVTANEGIGALTSKVEGVVLNEKSGNLNGGEVVGGATNGNGPHVTGTANLLDPNVKLMT